ncbi:carbohydrate ABC transporter permease [soil metagenome]
MADTPERDLPRLPPVVAIEQLAKEGDGAVGTEPGGIPGQETSERVRRVIVYILLFFVALLFFIPFFWSVTTSLKTLPESVGFDILPNDPSIRAHRSAISAYDFNRYFLNSVFLATVVTVTTLFLASIGGYAFARLRFPGREVLFMLVLGTLMIPNELRLVPVFQMLIDFPVLHVNLLGTYQGYFVINLVSAASLFLMRQYFLTIPKDYEEAAKLDGAGYFKTYWRVMLPLAGPALAAVTIITFQGAWNDFFWQLIIFLGDETKYTLPLGIFQFRTQFYTLWPELMAASVIAIVPIALLYVFFQRYFVAGVTAAGVKG